jgi:hypothetical protein
MSNGSGSLSATEVGARTDAAVDAACERAAWPPIRTMWQDSSAENEFMARGPFYLEDKAKVPAGAACLRLVAVLMYGCRPQDGDRIDHVASRGKCAKLVQALGAITAEAGRAPNEPCLFIVNIQVYEYAGSAPSCVCLAKSRPRTCTLFLNPVRSFSLKLGGAPCVHWPCEWY